MFQVFLESAKVFVDNNKIIEKKDFLSILIKILLEKVSFSLVVKQGLREKLLPFRIIMTLLRQEESLTLSVDSKNYLKKIFLDLKLTI